MPRTDIKTLAAVAEIVASVAVVVSLTFVVFSLKQNTAALRSINDNFMYELQDARLGDASRDPELAHIIVKGDAGEALSPVEELRFDYWYIRELNMWELALTRYREGLMPPSQWDAWNASFIIGLIPSFPEEKWNQFGPTYGEDFRKHIDAVYSDQSPSLGKK